MRKVSNPNIYEEEHLKILKSVTSECTLFLKRSNDDFPLKREEVNEIGLYGNGVRRTFKGGTGSGNVDIHVFYNIEQVFENNKIQVTTKNWLDAYDREYVVQRKEFIKLVKEEAKDLKINPAPYSVGFAMLEWEYDFTRFIHDDEITLYILSRCAGEGHDREYRQGSYLLTNSEVRDITYLAKHSRKFLLVVNTAFPIDLTPILLDVDNILLLNLLGSVTSETLYSVVMGETYPSGKLSSTWDRLENYPCFNEFGDLNKTVYKEGLFVGYRYYTTYNRPPMFPFGFGLSYTNFDISLKDIKQEKDNFKLHVKVKNTGSFKGKEVVQLYLSKPSTKLFANPRIELCGFAKTKELNPQENDEITIDFKFSDFACFDTEKDVYFLPKGIYQLSLGNSSINNNPIASIELDEDIILKKVRHIDENKDSEVILTGREYTYSKMSTNFVLSKNDFPYAEVSYCKYAVPIHPFVKTLSTQQLLKLSIGNVRGGFLGLIGDSCSSVLGGAGETCLTIPGLDHLVMVDGPAGLRICKKCLRTPNGKLYKLCTDPVWNDIKVFLPKIIEFLGDGKRNEARVGEVYYQYTTSIPVASALSNSFNDEVIYKCGEIVKKEMEIFNCDIWLAPAINIIRHPRCGRNFEYYSEDPYLTYRCAISMIKGVEDGSNKKTCIKHYCCNNQETNRTHSDSIVDIRTLREMYLRPFEKTIEYSNPYSIMTSYNLVNNEHASSSYTLINDILRTEFKFDGLIMTDWIGSGEKLDLRSVNESKYASKDIKAGVNICMPGKERDIEDFYNAIANGVLTIDDLKVNCSIMVNKIEEVKGKMKQ